MAKQRHRTVDLLRRFLLATLVLAVAALVGLYLFGRAGRPETAPPEEDDSFLAGEETPEGEITLVGEGFEFTHSEGERPVFRIRGEAVRADRGGTVFLDGVGLTLYGEEGTAYDVEADRATFNQGSREARLAGDVLLSGPDSTSLATRGMRLVERGEVLVSTGPVTFTYRNLAGSADNLRVNLESDDYVLTGDVRLESEPPPDTAPRRGETGPAAPEPAAPPRVSLSCNRLAFEGGKHLVRANGDVVLTRGEDRLEAALINVFLDDLDRVALFLRARWSVRGRMTVEQDAEPGAGPDAPPTTRTLSFAGRSLSLLRTPAGLPANAELEGAAVIPAIIDSPTPDGNVQRLVAGYLVGSFDNGLLTTVRAFNSPSLLEVDPRVDGEAGELRKLTGKRLEAAFAADARLVSLTAEEEVTYRDRQVSATGDQATFDVLEEKGVFTGDPVRLDGDRGEILAPKVTYERPLGLVYAQEGVRTTVRRAADLGLDGTPLAAGEGPLRVESREAFWRDQPRSVLFRGAVRAWRGENLLLAEVVRADQAAAGSGATGGEGVGGRKVLASGGVRTVWIPSPDRAATTDGGNGEAAANGADPPPVPVEVTANGLTYFEPRDLLVYEGRVRAEQGERVLTCQRLEVELTEGGEAKRLICLRDAVLDDRPSGNRARGARAVYDLASRTVTMSGDPVTLTKSDGAQVQGGRVEYDLETGTARVLAETPEPAATDGSPGAAAEDAASDDAAPEDTAPDDTAETP